MPLFGIASMQKSMLKLIFFLFAVVRYTDNLIRISLSGENTWMNNEYDLSKLWVSAIGLSREQVSEYLLSESMHQTRDSESSISVLYSGHLPVSETQRYRL